MGGELEGDGEAAVVMMERCGVADSTREGNGDDICFVVLMQMRRRNTNII